MEWHRKIKNVTKRLDRVEIKYDWINCRTEAGCKWNKKLRRCGVAPEHKLTYKPSKTKKETDERDKVNEDEHEKHDEHEKRKDQRENIEQSNISNDSTPTNNMMQL